VRGAALDQNEGQFRLKYRNAIVSDTEQIASLHADSWRRTYGGMMRDDFLESDVVQNRFLVWSQRLSTPSNNQFVVLAEDDGRVYGFACVFGDDDAKWGSLLDNIHVRSEMKGRGIGKRLIRSVAVWLQDRHPDSGLYLWVWEQNHRAQRFYESLGAANQGLAVRENPDGSFANNFRYWWPKLTALTIDAQAQHP